MASAPKASVPVGDLDGDSEDGRPSDADLDAMYGAPGIAYDDDSSGVDESKPLPDLGEAEAKIPAKTKAIMDELFRARIDRVQRLDPKSIR